MNARRNQFYFLFGMFVCVLIVVCLVIKTSKAGNKETTKEDTNVQSVLSLDNPNLKKGIDVSYHQGVIDWGQVKAAGIDFAMIRLGLRGYETGNIVLDDDFSQNMFGAEKAGIKRGVYFYSQALNEEEAKEEAEFVLQYLQDVKLDYPVAYDFEFPNVQNARTAYVDWEQSPKNAKAFCQVIEAAGYQTMIYSGVQTYSLYEETASIGNTPVWFARYGEEAPDVAGLAMWQYDNHAHIPGISENEVDLNVSFI